MSRETVTNLRVKGKNNTNRVQGNRNTLVSSESTTKPTILTLADLTDSERAALIKTWYNIVPENEAQERYMLHFATAFLTYVDNKEGKTPRENYLSQLRPNGGLPVLYNEHVMQNYKLYCITYDTLLYHDFKPSPIPRPNAHIPLKIAHVIYCGDTRAGDRTAAQDLIRKTQRTIKDKEKKLQNDAAEQSVTSTSTITNNVGQNVRTAVEKESSTEFQCIRDQIDRILARAPSAPSPKLPFEAQKSTSETHPKVSCLEEAISNLVLQMDSFQAQLNELKTSRERFRMPSNVMHQSPHNMNPMACGTSSNLATPEVGRENRHLSYDAKDHQNINAPTRANHAEQFISSNPGNALNISKRFGSKDQKYSGGDDECIYEFLDQYDAVSRDLCLYDIEKRQYRHNLFRGEALRFYNADAAASSTN